MLDNPQTADVIRPVLAMIRRNVELETRLIDDLLDVVRIAQGKMHLDRAVVDVHNLIFRTLKRAATSSRTAVSISGSSSRPPKSRRGGLRTSAAGLLEPDQECREVHAGWRTDRDPIAQPNVGLRGSPDKSLIVEISDTGIGIEPEALLRIFEVFRAR